MIEIFNSRFTPRKISTLALLLNLIRLFCIKLTEAVFVISCLVFEIGNLKAEVQLLKSALQEKDAEIAQLKKEAADKTSLFAKVDEIMRQMISLLGQNSSNSGWSPSTDGIKNFGKALRKLVKAYNTIVAMIDGKVKANNTVTALIPVSGVRSGKSSKRKGGSKRGPGAKDNHDGSAMNCIGMDPTSEVIHMPEKCKNCPRCEECKKRAKKKDCRMVYDIKFIIEAIAHYLGIVECPKSGEVLVGSFPANITGRNQYGCGVWAICAVLVEFGCVSINRVGQILRDALGIPVSDGTVQNAIMRGGELALPYVNFFRKHLLLSPCTSFDETGRHIYPSPELIAEKAKSCNNGEEAEAGTQKRKSILFWVHTAVNAKYTALHVSLRRGELGMREGGILPGYFGTAVHDCLPAYWNFTGCDHGLCLVHLQREVNKLKEEDPAQAKWLDSLMSFLHRLEDIKEETIAAWARLWNAGAIPSEPRPRATPRMIDAARREFADIVSAGRAMNPQPYVNPGKKGPGRKKKTAVANLLDRLEDHADDWIRFFLNFEAWGNNTIAERSFRDQKVSESVSKMIRSIEGARAQAALKSVIDTAKKHRLAPIKVLYQMYEGKTPDEVFNDPLPWFAYMFDPFDPRSPYSPYLPKRIPARCEAVASE